MSLLDTASLIVTPNGYKEGKLYSVIPSDGSGDLSVTRATTATRVNSAGLVESMGNNVPRLDYSNGTCPSLLVEPQRTNLALYSSSFDNAAWDKINGTMTANATTAPDGNTTAEQWAGDGTNTIHDFYQAFTGGSTTTSSIYVKKNTAQFVYISLNHQGTGTDWATGVYDLDNLTTATFQSGGVTNQVATISDEGNGWRRITLSVSTTDVNLFCMYGIANSLSPSFGANRGRVVFSTSASFYAWGAQLEAGSYPTSYIPTTSASVTRNADVVSKTGISSLIGQTEGTLFCDIYNTSNSNYGIVLSQTLGDYTNSIYFFNVGLSNQFVAEVFTGGVLQMAYAKGSTLSMGRNKIAITYKNNDFAVALNGVIVLADTLGSVPTTNNLDFTDAGIGTNYAYEVNAVALWKTRLTNTQLAQLTSI
jgi:hypothetical protein